MAQSERAVLKGLFENVELALVQLDRYSGLAEGPVDYSQLTSGRDPATLQGVESEPDQREPVVHEKSGAVSMKAQVSGAAEVERGLNGIRLAVLGIVVGIALTVAFGVEAAWWVRVLLGLGTFALTCFLFWWTPVRSALMEFMRRITGE